MSRKVTDLLDPLEHRDVAGPPAARVPKAEPTVWPWLSKAMANTTRDGTDGTDQFFGIPSVSQDWVVKQGWMTGLGAGDPPAGERCAWGGR